MYIIKCYCFKDSVYPNCVTAHKTRKSALKRKDNAIKSGCYYKVELIKTEK